MLIVSKIEIYFILSDLILDQVKILLRLLSNVSLVIMKHIVDRVSRLDFLEDLFCQLHISLHAKKGTASRLKL